MTNLNSLTLLDHQWKDFIDRLEILIHLSSQYERIYFHHIDSSLSDSKQRINEYEEQYKRKENIQSDLLTIGKIKHEQRDKSIEEVKTNGSKRFDVVHQEMADIQSFLNAIHEWKKKILADL